MNSPPSELTMTEGKNKQNIQKITRRNKMIIYIKLTFK